MPGDEPVEWSALLPSQGMKSADYQIAMRIVNPNPAGASVKFANASQADEWLVLID